MLLAGLGLLSLGCGGEERTVPEQLHPVSGVVTIDGSKAPGVRVNFVPEKNTKGTGGYAVTDASGTFNATHYSQTSGIEPGTYQVTFSKLAMPDGSPIPEGKDAADVGAVEILPAHLTQVQTDRVVHVITVTQPMTDLKYDLKTR